MTKEQEVIILAGGQGSRLGELGRETQKCLLPIDGMPMLGHILDSLIDAFGSIDLKVAVSYKSDQVKRFVD